MGFVPDYVAEQNRQPSLGDMVRSVGASLWGPAASVGQSVSSAAQSLLGGFGGLGGGGYPCLTDMGGGKGGGLGGGGGVASVLQSLPFLDMYGDDHKPGQLRPMNAGDIYEQTGEVVYT